MLCGMPPTDLNASQELPPLTFEAVAAAVGFYHVDAFYFVQSALGQVAQSIHGKIGAEATGKMPGKLAGGAEETEEASGAGDLQGAQAAAGDAAADTNDELNDELNDDHDELTSDEDDADGDVADGDVADDDESFAPGEHGAASTVPASGPAESSSAGHHAAPANDVADDDVVDDDALDHDDLAMLLGGGGENGGVGALGGEGEEGEEGPVDSRHVSGQQLCTGMRDLAVRRWGLLAGTVLRRWGIRSTLDFGRIVYALIDAGMMSRTPDDSLDDFKAVFDFSAAFDGLPSDKKAAV